MGESPEALMMPAFVHHVQLQPDLCAAPGTLRPSPVALRARRAEAGCCQVPIMVLLNY